MAPDAASLAAAAGGAGFKADVHKKWNEKTEEQKRRELVSEFTGVEVFL